MKHNLAGTLRYTRLIMNSCYNIISPLPVPCSTIGLQNFGYHGIGLYMYIRFAEFQTCPECYVVGGNKF